METLQIGAERFFCCESSSNHRQQSRPLPQHRQGNGSVCDLKACLADGSVGPTVGRVQRIKRRDGETPVLENSELKESRVNGGHADDEVMNDSSVDLDPVGFGGG
eukprot:CAMPEP_0172461236 /NCGR_PEP_ID=MMETSP1065-20121228/39751_1 /TAXON_ID=265537 /ORGANISM="Amphiprora paludosa, Strain CCMP125" /LENGTH=104 /DNA_ID=CAMNT_0013216487 /DNA_START=168 /DNA_END=479 /DNA_ORIENTATION=-